MYVFHIFCLQYRYALRSWTVSRCLEWEYFLFQVIPVEEVYPKGPSNVPARTGERKEVLGWVAIWACIQFEPGSFGTGSTDNLQTIIQVFSAGIINPRPTNTQITLQMFDRVTGMKVLWA